MEDNAANGFPRPGSQGQPGTEGRMIPRLPRNFNPLTDDLCFLRPWLAAMTGNDTRRASMEIPDCGVGWP